jgi:hypothetical protein
MTGTPSLAVATLVHRLSDCPDDFLGSPRVAGRGAVAVAAVVGDTMALLDADLPENWCASLAPDQADAAAVNWLRCCLVACWLVSDAAVLPLTSADQFMRFLAGDLHHLAGLVRADLLVEDPDRREELARLLLRTVDVVPAGETAEHAGDRLATLDSFTRSRVEAEARAAEERAREVRAALERKRAEEAAARASRE